MMTRPSVRCADAQAAPGEKTWGGFHLSDGDKSVRVAVGVIHGSKPGPHFVAMAGVHGKELNGVAAIHAFFEKVDPRELSGTIFLIPCANPRAAMMRSYVWPEDQHAELIRQYGDGPYPPSITPTDRQNLNMQCLWPGSRDGLLAERITHAIWTQAIHAPHRTADFVLDMHCYHSETSGAVALPDGDMLHFGAAAGLPTILNMRYKPDTDLCTAVCRRAGLNAMIVENRGQDCVTPQGAAEGLAALFNLTRYMKMLPGDPVLPEQTTVIDPWRDDRLSESNASTSIAFECASDAGLFIPFREPFEIIQQGELLGHLLDLYTAQVKQVVRAPTSGCLYSAGASLGVCEKGRRLIGVSIYECIDPRDVIRRRPFTPHA